MAIPKWRPREELTKKEQLLMKRLGRVRKLFGFLRLHRHELFDDEFQEQFATMYRDTGGGKKPLPPAMMAMASLLQGYVGASDAEAVELTVVDRRWQLVLDCLDADEPLFSQGALHDFRHRMIRHDMDRVLLERTVALARRTGGFDAKKLPTTLRVGMDSMPQQGAGRVEDTFNLVGHAARDVVACAAMLLELEFEHVCRTAGTPMLLAASIKSGLDVDWSTSTGKSKALDRMVRQLRSLHQFLRKKLPDHLERAPLKRHLDDLWRLVDQDLEPDPSGKHLRVTDGVPKDRQVSKTDPEMRHGRKSKSKTFTGFKRHIAADLEAGLILSCALTPGNQADASVAPRLRDEIERQGFQIGEFYVDLAYVPSDVANEIFASGGEVICKPRKSLNATGKFPKSDFRLNLRSREITCPAGHVETFDFGETVHFPPVACDPCPLRSRCTSAAAGIGRSVLIRKDERLQNRLQRAAASKRGRKRLRKRVVVEHCLAHLAQRQGSRARYIGARANLYDLHRAASIQNLEATQRFKNAA